MPTAAVELVAVELPPPVVSATAPSSYQVDPLTPKSAEVKKRPRRANAPPAHSFSQPAVTFVEQEDYNVIEDREHRRASLALKFLVVRVCFGAPALRPLSLSSDPACGAHTFSCCCCCWPRASARTTPINSATMQRWQSCTCGGRSALRSSAAESAGGACLRELAAQPATQPLGK
jgi:hypothetical protein